MRGDGMNERKEKHQKNFETENVAVRWWFMSSLKNYMCTRAHNEALAAAS
jgi:hypothetical protein